MNTGRKFIIRFLWLGVIMLTARVLSASETLETRTLFLEAEQLFQQASNTEDGESARLLYQKALYRFERVIILGLGSNGKLLYNIGNTYFRLGDIGRAILFYRRAQLLIPADPNLKHNLRYVRSRRVDLIPSWQDSTVYRTLFFWHYSFPPRIKVLLFIAAFWGICLITGFGLLQPNRRKRWKRISLTAVSGIALMMVVSLVTDEIILRNLEDGIIIAEEVVARKGDGIAYQRSFVDSLHQGTEFRLLEERAGWFYIELTDGRTGWIPDSAGEMVLPASDGG